MLALCSTSAFAPRLLMDVTEAVPWSLARRTGLCRVAVVFLAAGDANIGTAVLRRYKVTIDLDRDVLLLE